jgi:hypothetical protein
LTGRRPAACGLAGILDTTSGVSALRAALSIAAANGRGVRASSGTENTLTASLPQVEQRTRPAAVPNGKTISKSPSRGHRYSYLATPASLPQAPLRQ